jgi:hypothetical protein
VIQPAARSLVDNYVFLVGRPPISEFLGFVRTMAVQGQTANQGQLAEEWRRANDHVLQLEKSEAGIADNPTIQPLPEELSGLKQQVLADPIFSRTSQFVPTDLAMVELDKLVVHQKFINLGFVNELKASLGAHPALETVCRLALCLDRNQPQVEVMQTSFNVYTFISPSNDFRFLEAVLLDPSQIQSLATAGRAIAVLGLVVGYGSNYLSAVQIENRLVLNNGSHRAYAMRDLGLTHAPCLVERVSRRDELELTGLLAVQQNPDRYLKDPRPPLLKDYFDPRLTKVVPVQRKNRLVKVSFGTEANDIPAS